MGWIPDPDEPYVFSFSAEEVRQLAGAMDVAEQEGYYTACPTTVPEDKLNEEMLTKIYAAFQQALGDDFNRPSRPRRPRRVF